MKNKWFAGFGVLLALGLVLSGCDTDSNSSGDTGAYHLKWGVTSTTYSTVRSTITSQGWTVADSGSNWAIGTGSTASSIYNWCMGNVTFSDGGDFDGSFEECMNFSKDGVSASSGLKTAGNNNKANVPLAGIFDGGNSVGAVLFYITKN